MSMTGSPIKPQDIKNEQKNKKLRDAESIPSFVIEIVNRLIIEKYIEDTRTAQISEDDIVNQAKKEMENVDDFNYSWLNFEPLFEREGWTIDYYKRPYYETRYSSYFIFRH